MITLDTSGLIAALDHTDSQHSRAVAAMRQDSPPYLIPTAILSEIAYMLERGHQYAMLDAVLADIEHGGYELDCGDENIARIRQLMDRYADLPLGFADACVIACGERHSGRVLSLDRDFRIVAREGTITLVPE